MCKLRKIAKDPERLVNQTTGQDNENVTAEIVERFKRKRRAIYLEDDADACGYIDNIFRAYEGD